MPDIGELVPGPKRLQILKAVLSGDNDNEGDFRSFNIILTPLVVLTHLTEFDQYRAQNTINNGTKAIGFCTGLLSTFAVASSHTAQVFQKVRCRGDQACHVDRCPVDAEEARQEILGNGQSVSDSVAWANEKQKEKLREILSRWRPEVYLSVQYDRARATLTSSGRAAFAVAQELREAGVTVAKVGLHAFTIHPKREIRIPMR
ncbi:uncharacterized protein BDV17DRAFT_288035 [Aspergillus undulatus]|uniref:uncharacterized protein n=1 Tax=Aspergillus undulatus TaxID=1810928 RepID=UPI003CCCC58D